MARPRSTPEYQKAYKDQKRVVVYVEPWVKATLAEHATANGTSISAILNPAIRKVANGIKSRTV